MAFFDTKKMVLVPFVLPPTPCDNLPNSFAADMPQSSLILYFVVSVCVLTSFLFLHITLHLPSLSVAPLDIFLG